ncbi:MAG: acylphosphatase [Chloroflexi bacterium]|uniref:acylphosphatase n=1 Tax=Candidatus Chlorohelix allophototropha TaxID=3003348 RepID=A0A8T7M8G2_9CHLR|nr:acylphosphatase [Chloroflexota bacterium]WJW68178.1 acylphosphatase [Chloroflexota bacterium L227-S17]
MTDEISQKRNLRAQVHGRVQGVGYRQFVLYHAARLELTGWVRNNRFDHSLVELEAEGTKSRLENLLDLLYTGPTPARVREINIDWSDFTGTYHGFEVRY